MPTDNSKILDKIKKCLALAASANEHEAAAALRQAQKLMETHGIADEDVLASQASEIGAKAGAVTKPPEWEATLANRIGQAFGCRVVFSRCTWSTAEWRFIGAGASSEVAAYAFKVLLRQARTARQTYITTALKRVRKPSVKTVRADLFCAGWVRTAMSTVTAWTGSAGQAEAVTAYIASNYPSLVPLATNNRKPSRLQNHHVNDLRNGLSAGRDAVLNRGVGAGPDPLALGGA